MGYFIDLNLIYWLFPLTNLLRIKFESRWKVTIDTSISVINLSCTSLFLSLITAGRYSTRGYTKFPVKLIVLLQQESLEHRQQWLNAGLKLIPKKRKKRGVMV